MLPSPASSLNTLISLHAFAHAVPSTWNAFLYLLHMANLPQAQAGVPSSEKPSLTTPNLAWWSHTHLEWFIFACLSNKAVASQEQGPGLSHLLLPAIYHIALQTTGNACSSDG